ncbi:acyl carrier protein [Hahella ganghwensis]|uniref:acyl carrier protein n=1 Tax=Hahella ganghwensis TaxID=286420 RepID=UPI00036998AF|nr:acyl carrier protein [Hahella ganghwensis]
MDFETMYQQIAVRCASLLDMDKARITPDSNFFNLGGNSAKALQLCVMIEQDFPDLFGDEGIDLSEIARQPDMQRFVEALVSCNADTQVHEGEL